MSVMDATSLRMMREGEQASTGAFVTDDGAGGPSLKVAATTLDRRLEGRATAADRALLKLDIEGHELEALCGGAALVARDTAWR